MIFLTLPYPISANRYWKAITIPGRTMMAPSKEAKQYRLDVAKLCALRGLVTPIAGRLSVAIHLYPHRPLDFKARMRKLGAAWDDGVQCLDLDNANKVLLDSLKGIAFDDDKWVRSLQSQRMEPDEHGARVEIWIRQMALPVMQLELEETTA